MYQNYILEIYEFNFLYKILGLTLVFHNGVLLIKIIMKKKCVQTKGKLEEKLVNPKRREDECCKISNK